jgi:hypothetical protein
MGSMSSKRGKPGLEEGTKKPVDVYDTDLKAVLEIIGDAETQSVRFHGSKKAQELLAAVSSVSELRLLSSSTVPFVVLVAGTPENTTLCARFILEAWEKAENRLSELASSAPSLQCPWFVSNHSYAVAITNNDIEIPQKNLPPGCSD